MLTDICQEIKNWFTRDDQKHFGTFRIEGGTLGPLSFLQAGQYFRVIGSVFNDGIYQYPYEELKDETFTGAIWAMSIPPGFLELVEQIETYQTGDGKQMSGLVSESFGGYSYTRATDGSGMPAGWQAVFQKRLNQWRKL